MAPNTTAPLFIVVVPVKLLVPERIILPEPFLARFPDPERVEFAAKIISPLEASRLPLSIIFTRMSPPELLDIPVKVRFEPEMFVRVAFPEMFRLREELAANVPFTPDAIVVAANVPEVML